MPLKLNSIEKFIEKSVSIHGDKFGYDCAKYNGYKSNITLLCKFCNEYFEVICGNHLNPKSHGGCKNCKRIFYQARFQKKVDVFIEEAKAKHGDKYDYTGVKYVNARTKVEIKCNTCGTFFSQIPDSHVKGRGCEKCSYKKRGEVRKRTHSKFVQDSQAVHGNKYDYSKVIYTNKFGKVLLGCKACGKDFEQQADSHLRGCGCPNCKMSKGESKIETVLDLIGIEFKKQAKFKGCRNVKELRFDFFIPSLKIAIEYDGIQHFKPIEQFGGQQAFEDTKLRDAIKNRYCEANNIKLLRIPYTETDIEGCINRFLSSL